MEPISWHALTSQETLSRLRVLASGGLTGEEAAKRLEHYGPNQLSVQKKASPWILFLRQFQNALTIILLIATAISSVLGHETEAVAIAVIVILSVTLGFVQEFRAEKAMEKLRSMAAPNATVIRDGQQKMIPAIELVPGDIVLLAAGNRVPADARLLNAVNLRMDEAVLTGESLPSEKTTEALPSPEAAIGDRENMVFAGTAVAAGRGKAVVTQTGMATEFGRIAEMLQQVETQETPLQKNLDALGKTLAKAALGIVILISIIGFLRGEPMVEMFIFGIALAVAVVPEALPAVVTISLAIGVQRMVRRHALIRRLPAVETLGCTSVICTDKTGTLTKDEMTVRRIWTHGTFFEVSGAGYVPIGAFSSVGKEVKPHDSLREILRAGVLSSDARLLEEEHGFDIVGDPTEGALVVAAAKAGLFRGDLENAAPRIGEIPFSSETKRMTTLHAMDIGSMAFAKGAPETILPLCDRLWGEHGEEELTGTKRREITEAATAMAAQALRVLALARKGNTTLEGTHANLKFLGLVGMIDPPRPEAKDAIHACHDACIRVIMITGDHPVTAEAIARELGILTTGEVVTGRELEQMSDEDLRRRIGNIAVFARVSPGDKLRLVGALQREGHTVAMTGDGVNDAPALKKADIGIAMGITGTDVTKEAAAMTLTDDNFASIVAAVEEGRGIFGNIKKYLMYLLSSNVGEMITMTVASLLGMPLPLSAVQILYMNLATDGFPALALAVDPPEEDLMHRKPRDPQTGIFNRHVIILILVGSIWLSLLILGIFTWVWRSGQGVPKAMTMAFVLLVITEFFKAYIFRSNRGNVLRGMFRNKWLNIAVLWELSLLLCIVYIPFLQKPFGTLPLRAADWALMIALAATIVPVLETAKVILRRVGGMSSS
jgi:Ca2+-transporting ATPase